MFFCGVDSFLIRCICRGTALRDVNLEFVSFSQLAISNRGKMNWHKMREKIKEKNKYVKLYGEVIRNGNFCGVAFWAHYRLH